MGAPGELYDDVLHVPLLIRRPGAPDAGRRLPGLVTTLDVAPTILDVLGLSRAEMQGRSLLPLLEDRQSPEPRELLVEALRERQMLPTLSSFLGLRTDRWKVIVEFNFMGGITGRELYDLREDSGEQREAPDGPEREALEQRLWAQFHALDRRELPVRGLDGLTSQALRALGYLE